MLQAKPKLNQLKKYGNPKSRAVLHEQNIQLFGRQILEVCKSKKMLSFQLEIMLFISLQQ